MRWWVIGLVFVMAGCMSEVAATQPVRQAVDLPTIAVLPSLMPSDTPSPTVTASATFTPTWTATPSLTPSPSATLRASLTPYPHRWVVIATRPLPIGATITEDAVQVVAIPYEAAPLNAHSDREAVVGKIARTHFFCGQAVLESMTVEHVGQVATQITRIPNLADCAGGSLPTLRAPYRFTEIVFATQDMVAGRVIPAAGVEKGLWLASFTPNTAIVDLEAVVGQRLTLDVYAGQPILIDVLGE